MSEISTSMRARAHRANIERYRKLLAGRLTRVEREYMMRRIAEEHAELKRLKDAANNGLLSPHRPSNPLAEREKRASALRWEQRL